jgi:NAD(P)-dependent dehydrogenase (short-subunit alcohol dehydrogenase family)
MLNDFAGRRVVVTGATRGIGAAIARRFADGGATVTVTGRSAATDPGPRIHTVQADSSTPEGAALLAGTVHAGGPVDILVDAVGGSTSRGRVPDLTEEDWTAALQANLLAAVRLDL